MNFHGFTWGYWDSTKEVPRWRMAVFCAAAAVIICGCARTVAPRPVADQTASWDGNEQNSGFIGYAPDGSGIITSHAQARYNALVVLFGSRFVPPLRPGDGLKATGTNTWMIDAQHLEYFTRMNRWHKSGERSDEKTGFLKVALDVHEVPGAEVPGAGAVSSMATETSRDPQTNLMGFVYPALIQETNWFWDVEVSTNLTVWAPVLRNCYGPPSGELVVGASNRVGVYRVRGHRGWE